MTLRYGENPHQQAALYGDFLDHFQQLQGKELSFNNILDVSSAAYLIGEFERPTVAILKHTNPCGPASADSLEEAWEHAFATDRQAPFGGIIVVNNTLDLGLAEKISEIFCEVIIAPGFTDDARSVFEKKKNLRLLVSKAGFGAETLREFRSIPGGFLAQDRDQKKINPKQFEVVTERQPTDLEWRSMLFGWRVVRHVKSNAIVYSGDERTLGSGRWSDVQGGQFEDRGLESGGGGSGSEGFRGLFGCLLSLCGWSVGGCGCRATAAIQPGGSVRDDEVVAAANERGMAMVLTGARHFKH